MLKAYKESFGDKGIDISEVSDTSNTHAPVASPFVKWVGGKRSIVSSIKNVMPKKINNYWEPFLGGGAVFFSIQAELEKTAYLSDVNGYLMIAYKCVRENPKKLIKLLEEHKRNHSKEYYYQIRSSPASRDSFEEAAKFIYLNKTCYNGLYRVNSKNQFNVPIGRYENPSIFNQENLLAASNALRMANLSIASFETIQPSSGDLIYCDPPYHETFDSYSSNKFDFSMQEALRKCAKKWVKSGAVVIISNSRTKEIQKIYSEKIFKKYEIKAPRTISCKASDRDCIDELLIVGSL